MPLRIVFFGLPLAALLLAKDGHDVALVACSFAKPLGLRRARRTFGRDRVLMKPKLDDPKLLARVRALAPDLLVSWFWTSRLPMTLVNAARFGGIGAHPSLLPRHRGPDPFFWAISEGDRETGVTVHRLEEAYDTGEILAQEPLTIDPTWTAWTLARKLDRPSLRLLRATAKRFASGEPVVGAPQDDADATEAPLPDDEATALRWTWPTDRVLRHVRALAPSPGAWTEIHGAFVVITAAREATRYPRALEPGEGVVDEASVIVRTGDGAVELLAGEIDEAHAGPRELAALFLSRQSLG